MSRPSVVRRIRRRWTKKHSKHHYGYKNHINVDRRHKLIRRYRVTEASVHDSQVLEEFVDVGQHGKRRVGGQRLPVESH